MTIQSTTGKVALLKKDDVWVIEDRAGYPANFERIGDLLRKIWDLKTVQEPNVGPTQFARLELAEPLAGAGTKIEFKGKDGKALGALILGKKHMKTGGAGGLGGFGADGGFPAGRYVMQPGGARVSLVSETLEEVEAKPESWLSRDFFKIENPSAVTLAGTTDAQKWKLTRENATAEWKLDGAKADEKPDAAKTSPVGTAFAAPTFSDVLAPDAKPADTGLDKPAAITIETFDGFTYVLKAGKETNGNQPVTIEVNGKFAKERTPGKDEKPEDKTRLDEEFKKKLKDYEDKLAAEKKFEGRPFLIAKSTLDLVVKDRAALLAAPAASSPSTPPATVRPPESVATPPLTTPAAQSYATPPVTIPPRPNVPVNNPPRKPVEAVTPPVSAPQIPATKPATQPPATRPSQDRPAPPPVKPSESLKHAPTPASQAPANAAPPTKQ